MKKIARMFLMLILVASLLAPALTASAAPAGYWPYFSAYDAAEKSGNIDDILRTGDALLAFFSNYPIDNDIAGMSYNVYYYRLKNAIFEKRGDYDAAIRNAWSLKTIADYLGFTDASIEAEARAEKLDPMTEVYALSNKQTPAPYFGAKYEPTSGAYFGRVASPGTKGLRNAAEIAGESIVSFYVVLGQETAADFAWMISPYDDGKHLIHIALNFLGEAATASEVIAGTNDANINETLQYLAKLRCPVFLRIGGEMNVWENKDASLFKSAYLHVAAMARQTAPNVALVWSPNCVGSWGENIDAYYPGDATVDWVGMSLYNDPEPSAGQMPDGVNSMYFGRGTFADCVLSAKTVAAFASSHCKPVMVTEGGMGLASNATGMTFDAAAAAQITKRYTALDMVYPGIKAVIYFDNDVSVDAYKYALSDSPAVAAAYAAAVKANPTLLSGAGASKPSYVRLSDYCAPSGTIDLYAYGDTVYGSTMNVTFSLAGVQKASLDAYPYHLALDTSALAAGSYAFEAVFSDGAGYTRTKAYTLTKLEGGNVIFTDGYSAAEDAPAGWAKEEVGLALQSNLVPDIFQTRFSASITRRDFCRLAVNLVEQKTGKSIETVMADRGIKINYAAFSDTSDLRVLAASALGIVSGRGGGIFDGAAGISREEAAKMLGNTAELLGIHQSGTASVFSDAASFSSWAVSAISFVSAMADKTSGKVVMGGIGDNLFGPKGPYTYQQAYITMLRLFRAG